MQRLMRELMPAAVVWWLFFLVCFGLGYATLNRYDPRTVAGTADSAVYYEKVTGGEAKFPYRGAGRILVPLVARPFYRLAEGRSGSWDPVFLALLVSNCIFSATTAAIIVAVGVRLFRDRAVAMLGAALYLLNFNVVNMHMSGLVDSAPACVLAGVVWAMLGRRLYMLPVLMSLLAVSKANHLPFALLFISVWWAVERRGSYSAPLLLTLAAGAAGVVTFLSVVWALLGSPSAWWTVLPAALRGRAPSATYPSRLLTTVFNARNVYTFGWLLPLGMPGLRAFPRPWLAATLAVALAVVFAASYVGLSPAGVAFNFCGPLLSLSAAGLLGSFGARATLADGPADTPSEAVSRTHGDAQRPRVSQEV